MRKPKIKQEQPELLPPDNKAEVIQAVATPKPNRQLPARIEPPITPMQLMRKAVEAGNLDLVERLIALQERVDASAALKAFSDAMCSAQAGMGRVSRDAANPQTRSRYASFEALDRALRPIYSRHGFSLSFDTESGAPEGHIRVVCFVAAHGHQRKHHLDMPCDGKGAKGGDVMTKTHATMAAVAYARRGLLKMIFNVAEGRDTDDDGNSAGGGAVELISAEQAEALKAKIAETEVTEKTFCTVYKIDAVTNLPASSFDEAMARLETKKRKA